VLAHGGGLKSIRTSDPDRGRIRDQKNVKRGFLIIGFHGRFPQVTEVHVGMAVSAGVGQSQGHTQPQRRLQSGAFLDRGISGKQVGRATTAFSLGLEDCRRQRRSDNGWEVPSRRRLASAINNGKARDAIQAVYSYMKYSMLVKCEKCGYENFPQHRFCGMCAAELALPAAASGRPNPVPPVQVRRAVSPPAPVRLEREPVDPRSVSYLLDDEPAPSHWGRYLWLILLVGAVVGGWHWRADLVSLAARVSSNVAGANAQPNPSVPAVSGSPAEAAPASGVSAQADKPGTGVGDQAAPVQTPPPAAPAAATSNADSPPSAQPDQSQPSNPSEANDSASATPAAKPDDSTAVASQPTPVRETPRVQAQSGAMTADDLEAEGEKYLYGNGAPENCGRARKDLLAAAQRSNAKAENVLGTMYATGHCATRDLPTAYRWFSRSLRKDPNNTRIEQDLKVLWNQMTPGERQLALRDER
jgi:hypothetical protein